MVRIALAVFLSLCALPALAQSPTFVTSAKGVAGTPVPVTVYLAGASVAPSTITWTGFGMVCSPTDTGFSCVAATAGSYAMKATHVSGTFSNLSFIISPGLQFSSP